MKIRIALGSAILLGLKDGKLDEKPSTVHLLLTDERRCSHDCSFCAQARNSNADSDLLSRVTWPEFGLNQIIDSMKDAKRICLQVVDAERTKDMVLEVLRKLKIISLPISVSLRTFDKGYVDDLFKVGANRVCIALDAACPSLYSIMKGGSFDHCMNLLLLLANRYPGKISTHLIIGLGETEADVIAVMRRLHKAGITVALFAFTPIKGTALCASPKPDHTYFRRIQLARWLIWNDEDNIVIDDESVVFDIDKETVRKHIADIVQTSGCDGCNRPFYNESPRERPYNYASLPDKKTLDEETEDLLGSI
ncbi:radical SAM protein [Candidatus Woesearchaeota archaeon CG11_big_fil_rev_8_21_14_0_20_43_8]|nr:MAG: radical SAM protein [Candidatus Woesearchaeota archaeon CG11_big_fil_rev_8_21_14_0_20_43_8]PIO05471.1 MAG: radical SAM protein [Candidatus Woesearchaeota archaeon CG08_land_8_20_14_0_20_43_7]